MQATENGIDISEREMHALLGFCGDTAAQAQVIFRIKGKKVTAAATNARSAVEYVAENAGGEEGEFPVTRSFLELCAAAAVEGSKHVPAKIARLLLNRQGIKDADVVLKESGERIHQITSPQSIEPPKQLKFKEIHDSIDFDPDRKGHWYSTDMRHTKPLFAVQAAADKCPITWVPAADELSPVGFLAKGDGGEWRGVIRPVETKGPGKAAKNPEPDEDDDRQPELFKSSEGKAGDDDEPEEGDGIISDAKAAELAKKHGNGKPKAKVKNRSKATS
jgi:hypothetical protein